MRAGGATTPSTRHAIIVCSGCVCVCERGRADACNRKKVVVVVARPLSVREIARTCEYVNAARKRAAARVDVKIIKKKLIKQMIHERLGAARYLRADN